VNWWTIKLPESITKIGNFITCPVVENSEILNQEIFEKLDFLFSSLGGNGKDIKKAVFIDQSLLRDNFHNTRELIQGKHSSNPSLFKKNDWMSKQDANARDQIMRFYSKRIRQFRKKNWNDGSKLFVLPMLQGTTKNAAWSICENGFGTVSTRDAGFYEKGIYFTSNYNYAKKYSEESETGKVFLISLVIPGNVYPVIEPPKIPNEVEVR